MLLLEHQGKALLRRYGIATPPGAVVEDEASLIEAAADGGGGRKVLKAQVAAGGRGRAGGILFANGREEALAAFAALRDRSIGGHKVGRVLVEACVEFQHERYCGIQVDNGRLRLLFARRGGIDIEEITARDAENLRAIEIEVLEGPDATRLRQAFAELGLPRPLWGSYEDVARKLFALARACDAASVEINPLVETRDGRLVALDARIFLDETALGRQPELAGLRPDARSEEGAPEAGPGFKHNPEGGSIGLIGFGSGLNITLMDWIATTGGRVGTLIDIDAMVTGGRGRSGFAAAFEHMDRSPGIRAVLLCIISCGNRMDDVVGAMIEALSGRPGQAKPVIYYLRGNRMTMAQALLDEAGVRNCPSLAAAVADVVAASRGAPP